MTNASFLPAEALPPAGSAVREKSRFRRYSFSCDAAVEAAPAGDFADLADFAAFFELFGFATRLGLLGMGRGFQDRRRLATLFECRESALCEAAERPSRLSRLVIAWLRLREGRPGFRLPCPVA